MKNPLRNLLSQIVDGEICQETLFGSRVDRDFLYSIHNFHHNEMTELARSLQLSDPKQALICSKLNLEVAYQRALLLIVDTVAQASRMAGTIEVCNDTSSGRSVHLNGGCSQPIQKENEVYEEHHDIDRLHSTGTCRNAEAASTEINWCDFADSLRVTHMDLNGPQGCFLSVGEGKISSRPIDSKGPYDPSHGSEESPLAFILSLRNFYRRLNNTAMMVKCNLTLVDFCEAKGAYALALGYASEAQNMLKCLGKWKSEAYCTLRIAQLETKLGALTKALDHYAKSKCFFEKEGPPIAVITCARGLAETEERLGHLQGAFKQCEAATEMLLVHYLAEGRRTKF